MKLFIDKEFLDDFFIESNKENILHTDVINFFRKLKNYTLVTNYKSIDEIKKEAQDNPLLDYLTENIPAIEFNEDLASISDYPFSLYFLNKDSKSCKKLSDNNGFEYICCQNLEERWKVYYSDREDKTRKITKDNSVNENKRFDSWKILKKYNHPFFSLMIFDDFILADKTDQRIEDNLFPFLNNFINIIPNKSKVEITIITEFNKIRRDNDLKSVHKVISDYLVEIMGNGNFRLNIIKHNKAFNRGAEDFKPRRIYTNYFQIKPDGSLNFFKRNGDVSECFDITFNFNFHKDNWDLIRKELKDIKTYIDNIDKIEHLEMMYYPDKENQLLNIS